MRTRGKIIHSAIKLFSQYGAKAVSLQKIADDSGVQKSTIYYYFKTKADLMNAVISCSFECVAFEPPSCTEVEQLLREMSPGQILAKYGVYKNDRDECSDLLRAIYWLCFQEKKTPANVLRLFLNFRGMLNQLLQQLVELGAIPECDCETLSRMWSCATFVYSLLYSHGDGIYNNYRNAVNLYINIAVRGIRKIHTDHLKLPTYVGVPPVMPQNTKQNIAYQAFQLFCENGYEKTTMRQIAEHSGIQVGSIYNHYKDKKAMLREVLDLTKRERLDQLVPFEWLIRKINTNKDPSLLLQFLASNYLPTQDHIAKQCYRIIILEQYRDAEIRDFFINGLMQDCNAVAKLLDTLVGKNVIPPCPSQQIAQAYIFNHCSLSIRSVMFDESIEDSCEYRIKAAAVLVGSIMEGVDEQY